MTLQQRRSPGSPLVLITGATGYIGGRLVPVLEAAGVRLRCLARHPAALASRVSQGTEVMAGDLFDSASLDRALAGIDVAYYLVHSMGAHGDYLEKDRAAARNFGDAARRAGVRRIVYLGGRRVLCRRDLVEASEMPPAAELACQPEPLVCDTRQPSPGIESEGW